ncbi:MAG: hypothetical protein ABR613_12705 [Actinomycetota bacterium]
MTRSRTAQGRLLTAGCGTALLVLSFVPLWATYRVPGLGLFPPETVHRNAWAAYGLGIQVALMLAVAAMLLAAAGAARRGVPAVRDGRASFATSVAALAALVAEAVSGPEGSSDPSGYGISRGVLLFLGLGLACGMTYGGYVTMRGTRPERSIDGGE